MAIDTGSGLTYNPNYPLAGIDQSSQQFRDNYSIIKFAVENLQAKTINLMGDATGISDPFSFGSSPLNLTLTLTPNLVLTGNQGITVPSGPTSTRPGSPANGVIRYNTTTNAVEFYTNNNWLDLSTDSMGNLTVNGDFVLFADNNLSDVQSLTTTLNNLTVGYGSTFYNQGNFGGL